MSKALESVRCGSGGCLRSSQMVSLLPQKLLLAGWFVSYLNLYLRHVQISRLLAAQLKVNLRPLWAPAMKALSELSNRCDPVVWSLLFGDLRRLSEGNNLELSPEWAKESLSGDGDVIQEEERRWQDPSAHKMRVAVSSWTSDQAPRRKIVKVCQALPGLFPLVKLLADAALKR